MKIATKILLILLISFHSLLFAQPEHSEHNEEHGDEQKVIQLSPHTIKENNIELLTAGPHTIETTRDVLGKVTPNANKTLFLYPRYSGVIKKLTKYLGDKVNKGELLAIIESDQTLQKYSLTAPFSGYIVQKKANTGEHIKQGNPIYQIADLSDVWIDLFIYRKNAKLVKKGQKVIVYTDNESNNYVSSTISYVSPLGVEHNQTMLARAVFPNTSDNNLWLPGLYVDAKITIKEKKVPIAVKTSAIQLLDGKKIVFVKDSDGFEPIDCQFGIEGTEYTQVLTGISEGQTYVANNSFLLKAQLEKDSASHDH